jgi:hypothetical protein
MWKFAVHVKYKLFFSIRKIPFIVRKLWKTCLKLHKTMHKNPICLTSYLCATFLWVLLYNMMAENGDYSIPIKWDHYLYFSFFTWDRLTKTKEKWRQSTTTTKIMKNKDIKWFIKNEQSTILDLHGICT